jgi:hypothetical protein
MDAYMAQFTRYFLAFLGGLALTRLLYEAFFPHLLWLARPMAVLPLAALIAFLVWGLWQQYAAHISALVATPLLLNLLWLFNPTVQLTLSRFLFGAALWLTAVYLLHELLPPTHRHWRWLGILLVCAALLPVYLLTTSTAVGMADSFEFQVVAPQLGIAHPTGYPLYLLLGKLFTLPPIGTLAWRLNAASIVYAATAMSLLYLLLYRLVQRPLPAILGAVVTGLGVTFWSQAIIAEVYALHALIVLVAVLLMASIGNWRLAGEIWPYTPDPRAIYLLAFIIGLGMTNHVTTVFLIPPALLTLLWAAQQNRQALPLTQWRFWLICAVAFFLPLLLYAYLPLRWQAITGEPMGGARFVDWVVAGRFQGALQLRAWLDDPTRYAIMGRLFWQNWGWLNLALAGVGVALLIWRQWQTAVILGTLWLGYTFYTLNYYVPDLAVFVIPAQLMVGVAWGVGLYAVLQGGAAFCRRCHWPDLTLLLTTLLLISALLSAADQWPTLDQSARDGGEAWAWAVLARPLAANAAILADSEKIAPLHYLQVAEGLRPDLDISVWPDEAAYRAQVDGRIANVQTVYLARQLPGLQSIYHLRSAGPLTEVSPIPLTTLPDTAVSTNLPIGPLTMVGYALEDEQTAVTLYWQAMEPITEVLYVYVKLTDGSASAGQHPANNFYPTNAWRPGEIVPDYHTLPLPISAESSTRTVQVALAPPFADPSTLDWQPVTEVTLPPTPPLTLPLTLTPYRAHIGAAAISAAQFPDQNRAGQSIPLLLSGQGASATLTATLTIAAPTPLPLAGGLPAVADDGFTRLLPLPAASNGRYTVLVQSAEQTAVCGWMQPVTTGCALGDVLVSGVALPETAVNFADQIALLEITPAEMTLQPGGELAVTVDWLALADMAADYTVFLQVVDANDRIVGQVDSWPVQGTRPTSQWQPEEQISDPYRVRLAENLPPGDYRLLVGWYLLADGHRLPVLHSSGAPMDDKVMVEGFTVGER